MTFFFFLLKALPALAADPTCFEAVKATAHEIDVRDRAGFGQLSACFDPFHEVHNDFAFSMKDLQVQLKKYDEKFRELEKRMRDVARLDEAGAGGSICGAPEETKRKVSRAADEFAPIERAQRELLKAVEERETYFNASVREPRTRRREESCRASAESKAEVAQKFAKARKVCEQEVNGQYAAVGDQIAVLKGRLRRGCNPPKGKCELKQKGETHDVGKDEVALYRVWLADGDSYTAYTEGTKSQAEALLHLRRCKLENGEKE